MYAVIFHVHMVPLFSFVLVPNCVSNCITSESSRTKPRSVLFYAWTKRMDLSPVDGTLNMLKTWA